MDHIEIIDDLYEKDSFLSFLNKKFLVSRKLLNAYTFEGLCLVRLSGFFKSLSEVCYAVDNQALSPELYRELLCRCSRIISDYEGSGYDYMSNHVKMMEDGLESLRESGKDKNTKWDHFEENYVLCKLRWALKNDELLIDLVNDSIIGKLDEERKKREEKEGKNKLLKMEYSPVDVIEEDKKNGCYSFVMGDGKDKDTNNPPVDVIEEDEKDEGIKIPPFPHIGWI